MAEIVCDSHSLTCQQPICTSLVRVETDIEKHCMVAGRRHNPEINFIQLQFPHSHTHTQTRMHAHVHTHTRTHARTHAHTHTHTHARTHARTHTHTHTHTHTTLQLVWASTYKVGCGAFRCEELMGWDDEDGDNENDNDSAVLVVCDYGPG